MNKSIILDIFQGKRGSIDCMKMPKEKMEYLSAVCNACNKLEEKLSPELKDLHLKLMDSIDKGRCNEVEFYFTEGFKLGLLIGIECMD